MLKMRTCPCSTAAVRSQVTGVTDLLLLLLLAGNSSRGDVGAGEGAVADVVDGSLASPVQAELRADALDTVRRVDVLDQGDLPAGGAALAGGDGRVGEEVLPDLEDVSAETPCIKGRDGAGLL